MTFARKRSPRSDPASAAEPAAGHDDAEFEQVFQQHWTRICNLLYRLTGDPAEAEDLALDVFWRLYRQPPQEEQGNLAGWLYRAATWLGLNALRARKRRQRYEEQSGYQALEDRHSGDPAPEVEQSLERERVRQALATLKPRSAKALVLRSSGLSYREIAKALEVSPGSVGTLLARAAREFEASYLALEP